MIGFESAQIAKEQILLCTSILADKQFDKYRNELVLVESFSTDDAGLIQSYGFTKIMTLPELCSLYPHVSELCMIDTL